jgi:hypothetical protein
MRIWETRALEEYGQIKIWIRLLLIDVTGQHGRLQDTGFLSLGPPILGASDPPWSQEVSYGGMRSWLALLATLLQHV